MKTYTIDSLSSLIGIIETIKEEYEVSIFDRNNYLFFRGLSNINFESTPSICRVKTKDNRNISLLQHESRMIDELIKFEYETFANLKNDFDVLAKMQHFNLPTRIIDYTENPLVALYFACQDSTVDGKIIVERVREILTENKIETILSLPKVIENSSDDEGNTYLSQLEDKYLDIISSYYCNIRLSSFFARPPYMSLRERNQESIFKFPLVKLYKVVGPNRVDDLEELKDEEYESLIELCHYKDNRLNAIIVSNNLKLIDNNDYIILIPKENKNKILQSLSNIGVKESFIYPTLENTAKNIVNKYIQLDEMKKLKKNNF